MRNLSDIQDLRLLFGETKPRKVSKGEVLHASDQPATLILLVSGFVKRYFISKRGDLGVQAIYGEGDVFPLTVVFQVLFDLDIYQGPEVYYYEAVTDLKIQTLDPDRLGHIARADPMLYGALLKNAGLRFHSNIQFLENLRLHGAYAKTAHQLAYFGQRFGEKVPEGIRIKLPLTHQDIADIIGTTRETVTASIIRLRDSGLIKTDHNILILDPEKLTAAAYS